MSLRGSLPEELLATTTRVKSFASQSVLASLSILTILATIPRAAFALSATGNSTLAPAGPTTVNLDLTTAAVVTFILLLLGLAAGILLMGRFLVPRTKS